METRHLQKQLTALDGLCEIQKNKIMVRAKFRCDDIVENSAYNRNEIILFPVTCGSKENEEFFDCTPYGKIVLGTVNQEALKEFEVGKEYYIDFTKAE